MPIKKRFYKRRSAKTSKSCKRALTKSQRHCVKKMIDRAPETKYHNVTSVSGVTYTADIVELASVSQGDGATNREGDVISPTSLSFRYRLARDTTASTSSPDNVRFMIIQWHVDSSVATPTFTDILQNPTAQYMALSPLILNRSKRLKFTVLYDKVHYNICDRSLGKEAHAQNWLTVYPKRKITYNAGATTGRGKIYIMVLGQQGSTTEDCAWLMDSTLRFKDM